MSAAPHTLLLICDLQERKRQLFVFERSEDLG